MLELAALVFKAQAAKLQQALQRTLKDADDEEAVHDVRVACCRLNVALVNTESLFRKPVVKGTRKRVKTLMSFLGELRDAEVQSERVRALAERTGSEPVKRVAESLEAHTELLRLRMLGEIERGAYDTLPRLIEVLPLPAVLRGKSARLNTLAVAEAAQSVLLERLLAIEEYNSASEMSDSTTLHELRIAYKKLRYSADFFATKLCTRLDNIISVAKKYQEVLGDLHDADVAEEMFAPMLRKEDLLPSSPASSGNGTSGGHDIHLGSHTLLYEGIRAVVLEARADQQRLRQAFADLRAQGLMSVVRAEIEALVPAVVPVETPAQ